MEANNILQWKLLLFRHNSACLTTSRVMQNKVSILWTELKNPSGIHGIFNYIKLTRLSLMWFDMDMCI